MWSAEQIVAALIARGELWEAAPGSVGIRGNTFALLSGLERAIARLAASETADDWRVPSAVTLETLARADYFASFPQWLTLASHLDDDEAVLERLATHPNPAQAARDGAASPDAALPPAVCYHVYANLAERTVASPTLLTAQGTCWRHEGKRHAPLERGWAFTMRELVCIGTPEDTAAFRLRGMQRAAALAEELGLTPTLEEASDPFFAPTARGKALLQRVKALKHELLLPIGGRAIAAASFNQHESFFGTAFDIRTSDGAVASTACVAFGLERWLLAFLCAHGPEPAGWPAVPDAALEIAR